MLQSLSTKSQLTFDNLDAKALFIVHILHYLRGQRVVCVLIQMTKVDRIELERVCRTESSVLTKMPYVCWRTMLDMCEGGTESLEASLLISSTAVMDSKCMA